MESKHVYSILGGIAVAAAIWAVLFYLPSRATEDADVTVTGTIISSEVDEDLSADQGDRYTPRVTYRYQIDGENYKNDHVEAGGVKTNYRDRSAAQSIVSTYSEGDTVTVHVNSDDPQESFLEPPSHGFFEYLMVLFPLLFAGLAAYAGLQGS